MARPKIVTPSVHTKIVRKIKGEWKDKIDSRNSMGDKTLQLVQLLHNSEFKRSDGENWTAANARKLLHECGFSGGYNRRSATTLAAERFLGSLGVHGMSGESKIDESEMLTEALAILDRLLSNDVGSRAPKGVNLGEYVAKIMEARTVILAKLAKLG